MDKTAFKIQSFKEADCQQEYWQTRSLSERLEAAIELTKVAYQFLGKDFPPMEKTLTSYKKRNG